MGDINPLVFNKLLSIYAKSDLNNIEYIDKVLDEAFDHSDNLYEVYEYISRKLNIKLKLTNADIVNILSTFYINIREREMRLRLFQTEPYWWLITPDKNRIKEYLLTKLTIMLDKTSSLGYSSKTSPTINSVAKGIKEGSIPPVSELSNEELFEVLKQMAMSKSGKMIPSLLKKNMNPTNMTGLTEVLNELSMRELSESERKLLTDFIKTLLDYMKSMNTFSNTDKSESIKKLKQAIMENYHNIEVDEELIDKLSEVDSTMGLGLFYSKIDKIIEEDADKLIRLLPELNSDEFSDLFDTIKQKLMDLTLTKTSWIPTGHKKHIDYRGTIYKTIKNANIPTIAYIERQDTIGDIIFLVDASGSMRTMTKHKYKLQSHLDALQVSLITAWLFIKAIKEFGNGEYKLLIFANKLIDVTDFELEKIISLVKNPDTLNQIIGGGTNLYPALKHIKEKYAGADKNLILITDTGDLAVGDNKQILKTLKKKTKNLIVACPSEFFEETAKPFKEARIPLIKYETMDDLIESIKEMILA